MSNISLRAYNREIESQIDNNQIEEAIAHCRHILITYPKHLDTYRLLAKAYLEAPKYSDALDILQRILSVSPDDFIAHIGMSIVRENENNIDAAIWHMERAFDFQPSNSAVQDELKRLIGRKEGIEPAKIRLTRGALVRMYMRGNLFTQAIAEARAALAEDPTRMDLQVILARALNLAGLKAEAVELAKKILDSLPFCMESHRILIANTALISVDEAAASRKKLVELDPYYEFISASIPTIEQVPDNSVLIEKLEWREEEKGFYEQRYPEVETSYTSSSEATPVQFEEPINPVFTEDSFMSAEQEPLATIKKEEIPSSENFLPNELPSEEATPESSIEPDNIMPEWMSSAGWQTGKSDEEPAPSPFESTPEEAEEIAPAELPDWLKSMAPIEEKSPDSRKIEPLQETPEETFDFLASGSLDEPLITASEESELPDWLNSITSAEEIPAELSKEETTQEIPATEEKAPFQELSPEQESIEKSPNDELPEWLRAALEDEDSLDVTQKTPSAKPPEITPGWVQETAMEATVASTSDTLPSSEIEQEPITEPLIPESAQPTTSEPISGEIEFHPEIETNETPFTPEAQGESIDQLFRRELEASEDDIPAFHEPIEPVAEEEPLFFKNLEETEENVTGSVLDETVISEEVAGESTPLDLPDWLKGFEEAQEAINEEPLKEEFQELPLQELPEVTEISEVEEVTKEVNIPESQFVVEEEIPETVTEPLPPVEPESVSESETLEDILQKVSIQIQQKQNLEVVIDSLTQLAQDHPEDVQVWQMLGDAYFKNNQIQQAIDAYAKAEEVLK
jgi:cytochrome c-type biogenesis protein CcmH/NrfG